MHPLRSQSLLRSEAVMPASFPTPEPELLNHHALSAASSSTVTSSSEGSLILILLIYFSEQVQEEFQKKQIHGWMKEMRSAEVDDLPGRIAHLDRAGLQTQVSWDKARLEPSQAHSTPRASASPDSLLLLWEPVHSTRSGETWGFCSRTQ